MRVRCRPRRRFSSNAFQSCAKTYDALYKIRVYLRKSASDRIGSKNKNLHSGHTTHWVRPPYRAAKDSRLPLFHPEFGSVPHSSIPSDSGNSQKRGACRPRNYCWAELMRRVYLIDVLECPRCGGRMRILAAIHFRAKFWRVLYPQLALSARGRIIFNGM